MSIDLPSEEGIRAQVRAALQEDLGTGDVTSALLPADQWEEASIITRQDMVLCGQAWVRAVFHAIDARIQLNWHKREGDFAHAECTLCTLKGPIRALLTGERTALNFLQCLSGTATQTRLYVEALTGTTTRLLDTRKTLPGLRLAQKYAVRCGGGMNHRLGLYDAFLIKENHIAACGSVEKAIGTAYRHSMGKPIIVEVEEKAQLLAVLTHSDKVTRVLLDNFSLPAIREAVAVVAGHLPIEVSGQITGETIRAIAETGVDFISTGAITKNLSAIDLSMYLVCPSGLLH